jgi:hypothetical protein
MARITSTSCAEQNGEYGASQAQEKGGGGIKSLEGLGREPVLAPNPHSAKIDEANICGLASILSKIYLESASMLWNVYPH